MAILFNSIAIRFWPKPALVAKKGYSIPWLVCRRQARPLGHLAALSFVQRVKFMLMNLI